MRFTRFFPTATRCIGVLLLTATAVHAQLTITTAALPDGYLGNDYSQSLAVSGGAPPYAWSLSAGTLPYGLSLGAPGVISGAPVLDQAFNFTVRVQDTLGATATKPLGILVGQRLMIVNSALDTMFTGESSAQTLQGSGGGSGYLFSVAGGTLPPGCSLNIAGSLNCTPGVNGSYPVTFKVRSGAAIALRTLKLTVISAPDHAAWDSKGLFGGAIGAVAVSPRFETDRTLFAAGQDAVIYRSTDAGYNWSRVAVPAASSGERLHTLKLSPTFDLNDASRPERATVFAASAALGVLKSVDHGATFTPANAGIPCAGDPASCRIYAMEISPEYETDHTLWLLRNDCVTGTIYRSTDGGENWSGVFSLPQRGCGVQQMTASPDFPADHNLFMIYGSTVYHSSDAGMTWYSYYGPTGINLNSLALSPEYATDRAILVADNKGAVFLKKGSGWFTNIAGVTGRSFTAARGPAGVPVWYWKNLDNAPGWKVNQSGDYLASSTHPRGIGIPTLPVNPNADVLMTGPAPSAGPARLFYSSASGLYGSADEGVSFAESQRGIAALGFKSLSLYQGSMILGGVSSTLTAGGSGSWLRSLDGGSSWTGFARIGAATPQMVYLAAMSPNYDADHILFLGADTGTGGASSICFYRSDDGGLSFTQPGGLACAANTLPYAYGFLPGFNGLTGTMYLGRSDGLYKSTDGGRNFTPVTPAFPCGGSVNFIAISPNYAADSTLFITTYQLCKSTDGGGSWSTVENGAHWIDGAFALSPVYNEAGLSGTPEKTIIATDEQAQPIRSTDGGVTWSPIAGLPVKIFGGVPFPNLFMPLFSPSYPVDGTVFMAFRDWYHSFVYPGIWRSDDFGASFAPLGAGDALGTRQVTGLYLAPDFDGRSTAGAVAVAATLNAGIWRSVDGGRTFQVVEGYKFIGGVVNGVARVPGGTAGLAGGGTPDAATAISAGSLLIATADQGVFQSDDLGASYTNISAGLPVVNQRTDARAITVPSGATTAPLAAVANGGLWRYNGSAWTQLSGGPLSSAGQYTSFIEDDLYLYATRADGVSARANKDGTGWTSLEASRTDLVRMDYNPSAQPTTAAQPSALIKPGPDTGTPASDAASAITASLWSVSQSAGPMYSLNNGTNWSPAPGGGDYTLPGGQSYTTIAALGVNTASGGREVLAGTSTGLYLTRDGGASWRSASGAGSGLESTSRVFSAMITALNGNNTTDILAGVNGSANGGVYLSGDGGEHWTQINQGFDPNSLNITTLAKTSCSGCPVQYYSGTFGSGVYTRTIPVVAAPSFPSASAACFGFTGCVCASTAGSGPEQGGQAFKLCGANFQALAVVEFDGVAAAGCTTVNAATITCAATPPHVPGAAQIRVRNPDTRAGYLPNGYNYTGGAPRVAANSLKLAKSGSNAALTYTCSGCTSPMPQVYRSQNSAFNLNLEMYTGGIGSYTNTGALAAGSNNTYFWNVE